MNEGTPTGHISILNTWNTAHIWSFQRIWKILTQRNNKHKRLMLHSTNLLRVTDFYTFTILHALLHSPECRVMICQPPTRKLFILSASFGPVHTSISGGGNPSYFTLQPNDFIFMRREEMKGQRREGEGWDGGKLRLVSG